MVTTSSSDLSLFPFPTTFILTTHHNTIILLAPNTRDYSNYIKKYYIYKYFYKLSGYRLNTRRANENMELLLAFFYNLLTKETFCSYKEHRHKLNAFLSDFVFSGNISRRILYCEDSSSLGSSGFRQFYIKKKKQQHYIVT